MQLFSLGGVSRCPEVCEFGASSSLLRPCSLPVCTIEGVSSASRRSFLGATAAALSVNPLAAQTVPKAKSPHFAVSSYSYWHFHGERYPIERVIDQAATLGFDGVEILHRQMLDDSPETLTRLKRAALLHGVALVMFSIHQDFVSPWADERGQAIRHTQYGIELASKLGCPGVRINSGRWRTIRLFDDLMKVKGDEPPIPGYTEKDAVQWCISSIRACIPAAEKAGVMLMLENHWGVTMKADNLLRIVEGVNSPWLGVNLDIGNFPGDPYPEIEKLAPHAAYVHFKTYFGGGEYYTLNLDYKRIAGILRQAKFNGYVSLEMEGKEAPESAVAKSLDLMRNAFA
jgi:L-ribulose-5-phosphate 3-epimerase